LYDYKVTVVRLYMLWLYNCRVMVVQL